VQAFWWGIGEGNGIEASELATVRGEKEVDRKAIDVKNCELLYFFFCKDLQQLSE
jgi:hypothetical protein